MQIRTIAVLTSAALASIFASGCASAPTQTAQKEIQSGCSSKNYTVVAGKTWDAEGLCTLEVMEANNEKMKQESRYSTGVSENGS